MYFTVILMVLGNIDEKQQGIEQYSQKMIGVNSGQAMPMSMAQLQQVAQPMQISRHGGHSMGQY